MATPISAAVITLNEGARIERCLSSLGFCQEIVLVDSGSEDDTIAKARRYTDKIFYEEFRGDGRQKNIAVAKTKNPWVFLIDADEVVSPALSVEIRATVEKYGDSPISGLNPAQPPPGPVAWAVPRKNYVGGVWVRHGGWFPDYQTRLWLRGRARYEEVQVHPGLVLDGPLGRLKEPLDHYTYDSLDSYRQRMVRYAEGRARDYFLQGRRAHPWDPVLHRAWAFFRAYLLRGGFRDGALGWRLALLTAAYTGLKYRNLRSFQTGAGPL